jgi:hypothetical protein
LLKRGIKIKKLNRATILTLLSEFGQEV